MACVQFVFIKVLGKAGLEISREVATGTKATIDPGNFFGLERFHPRSIVDGLGNDIARVFAHGDRRLLSRSWLHDPVEAQVSATAAPARAEKEPWNGEFYACFGEGPHRSWKETRRFGFLSAGGGAWYSNTLNLLNVGDRVWVKAPGYGFVGVGIVSGKRVAARDFRIETPEGERAALDVLTERSYFREVADDPERSEYFVPMTWLHTVDLEQAVNEIGLFGNQNTVCKPTTPKWRLTVERLKERWPDSTSAKPAAAPSPF